MKRLNLIFIVLFFGIFNVINLLSISSQGYLIKFKSDSCKENFFDKFKLNNILKETYVSSVAANRLNHQLQYTRNPIESNLSLLLNYYILDNKGFVISDSIIYQIRNDDNISLFEPNYIYKIDQDNNPPNDQLYKSQWYLNTVNALKAWQIANGKGVLIGFVDTGINFTHPDLENQLWINPAEDINHNGKFEPWPSTEIRNGVSGDLNGIDDDGNGFIDDVIGYDFVNQLVKNIGDYNEPDPIPDDEMGHGTQVAGIMAAEKNNNQGIAGLANGAKLMAIRAFDFTGNGESDNIAAGIVYAALNGCQVLNCSFGETISSSIVHDAIKFAKSMGVFIVVSAGNDGNDESHYPADYNEVFSVGWSDQSNKRFSSSNYGNRLTLMAPGSDMISTYLNGRYKSSQGTSFSAPLVSASAALLLQKYPNLKPDEIGGILQTSAKNISGSGWTYQTGSGILDTYNALIYPGYSNIQITSPQTDQNIGFNDKIPIKVSVLTPLFDKFSLEIGLGINPNNFTVLYSSDKQVDNDSVFVIDGSSLIDTVYVLRLKANLKNNSTVEKRIKFYGRSTNTLNIISINSYYPWHNNKRILNIDVKTNFPAKVRAEFNYGVTETKVVVHEDYLSAYHSLYISDEIPGDTTLVANIVAEDGVNITQTSIFIKKPSDEATTTNFIQKYNTLPLLYLFNGVSDLYNDKAQSFCANDISNGVWQSTKTFEFNQNEFILKDSLNEIWIPVGYGDSNGDGSKEILTKAYGSTVLFQMNKASSSPFSTILFADSTSGNLWAGGFKDIDSDGNLEFYANSDTAVHFFKFTNGKYNLISSFSLDSNYKKIGSAPGIVIDDLDGDGQLEIALSNEKGNLFIYGINNGKYNKKFISTEVTSGVLESMIESDIDGDGKKEIVLLNYGSALGFGDNGGEPMWNLFIYKAFVPNSYKKIWEDHFYGVRSGTDIRTGFTYRNGLASGNVDNSPGDEIIVSAFPNLYVFKWDTLSKKMNPIWYYPNSFANSAIIHDFDKNGINEFGFSTQAGTQFFELDTNLIKVKVPKNANGWSIDDSTAYIHWQSVDTTYSYEIYQVITNNNQYITNDIGNTKNNEMLISGLDSNKYYYFALKSKDKNGLLSDFSDLIEIYTHNPIIPLFAIAQDNIITVHFSGKLPQRPIISDFTLKDTISNFVAYPATINLSGDSTYLLSFDKYYNGKYLLFANSFPDYYKTPSVSLSLGINFLNLPNLSELYLTKLQILTNKLLRLTYSDLPNGIDAININNYILKPYGLIKSVTLDNTDNHSVLIELDNSLAIGALGKNYTITVYNVKSVNKLPITKGAGNTLGFVFDAANLNNIFVYPNPINLNLTNNIIFANLMVNSKIKIMYTNGNLIRELIETDGNGGVEWDGRDSDGNLLSSGIYIFKAEYTDLSGKIIESELKKLAIIR